MSLSPARHDSAAVFNYDALMSAWHARVRFPRLPPKLHTYRIGWDDETCTFWANMNANISNMYCIYGELPNLPYACYYSRADYRKKVYSNRRMLACKHISMLHTVLDGCTREPRLLTAATMPYTQQQQHVQSHLTTTVTETELCIRFRSLANITIECAKYF